MSTGSEIVTRRCQGAETNNKHLPLTSRCECTEARWVHWNCSGPTAAAGIHQERADGQVSTFKLPHLPLQGGTGQLQASVACTQAGRRAAFNLHHFSHHRFQSIGVSPSPSLTVTQHFSAHIAREGPAVSVDPPSASTLFASGLALQARSDLRCRNLSLAPTDLVPSPSPRRPRPRFLPHPHSKSTPIPNSK